MQELVVLRLKPQRPAPLHAAELHLPTLWSQGFHRGEVPVSAGGFLLRSPVLLMRWLKEFWDYLGSTQCWWGH